MPGTLTAWLRPPRLRTLAEWRRSGTPPGMSSSSTWCSSRPSRSWRRRSAGSRRSRASRGTRLCSYRSPGPWSGVTFYANRFDTDDVAYRLVTAVAMLAIVAVAVSVHSVMRGGEGSVAFAVAYVGTRACLLALYLRARRHATGAGRRLIDLYLLG